MFEQQFACEKKQKNCVFNRNKSVKWKEKERARMRKRIHTVFKMKFISYVMRQRPVRTDVQGYCMHRHTYNTALSRTRSISSFLFLLYIFVHWFNRKKREREGEKREEIASYIFIVSVLLLITFAYFWERKEREEKSIEGNICSWTHIITLWWKSKKRRKYQRQ